MMSTIREERLGVIFDLDGVLLDSYEMHFECWSAIAKEYSIEITRTQFDALFGRMGREIAQTIWGSELGAEEVFSIHRRKQALFRENLQLDFPAMDGAVELIDALVEAGFVLSVGSSAPPENVKMSLKGLGRTKSFSALATGDEVACGKPDPQVFLLAAQRMGLNPAKCAVIEDAPVGIEAALASGMTAIAIARTTSADRLRQAHLVVVSLRELTPKRIRDLILAQH